VEGRNWMAKPRKTNDLFVPIFHEVLEGMAYARLSPNEWQFIMVLWRLTYGRKNMQGQDGQWTPWVNAEFHRRTGLQRSHISRIKTNLQKKKVIQQKKGKIGFNKHFKKWDKQCLYSTYPGNTSTGTITSPGNTSTGTKVLPVQPTTVTSTGTINAPQVLTSEEVQSLKKERKKETYNNDENFNTFWEKYPKKNDNKKAARKAWDRKIKTVSPDTILAALEIDMAGVFKDASENKFLPGAGPWLNRERWEDLKPKPVDKGKEELKQRLREMVRRYEQDISYKEQDFLRDKEELVHLINTYKEIK
jgi:hypothetical protein